MKFFFLFLFIASCTLPPVSSELLVKMSPTKQKQKIAFLQKKLNMAEKEQKRIAGEIDFLQEEIKQTELAFVRRIVSEMEEKLKKFEENPLYRFKMNDREISNLFLDEREILHRLIRTGPTPASLEAQGVLDQILRLITSLNEESDERPRFN